MLLIASSGLTQFYDFSSSSENIMQIKALKLHKLNFIKIMQMSNAWVFLDLSSLKYYLFA